MKIYNLLTKLESKKPIPIFSLDIYDPHLIISSTNGDLDLYKDEVFLKTVKKHAGAVLCVRFNNQGSLIASCGDDGTVIIYDLSLNVLNYFKNHTGDVTNVLWTEKYLISVGHDGNVIFYDFPNFKLCSKIRAHECKITGVAGNKKNDFLCTQGEDGLVLFKGTTVYKKIPPFEGVILESFFSRMSWSPDGQIFSCGLSFNQKVNSIEIYNMEMESRYSLLGHVAPCEVTCFNPNIFIDNTKQYFILAAGSQDLSISLWTTLSPHPFLLIKNVSEMPILDLMWSHEGSVLYFCSYDGTVGKLEFDMKELGNLSTKEANMENSDLFLTLLNAELYDEKVKMIIKEKDKKPVRRRKPKQDLENKEIVTQQTLEMKKEDEKLKDKKSEKNEGIKNKEMESKLKINSTKNEKNLNEKKSEKNEGIKNKEMESKLIINLTKDEKNLNEKPKKEQKFFEDHNENSKEEQILKDDQKMKDKIKKDQKINEKIKEDRKLKEAHKLNEGKVLNNTKQQKPIRKLQDSTQKTSQSFNTLDKLKKMRHNSLSCDLSTDTVYNSSDLHEYISGPQNIEIHGEPKKPKSYLEILSHEAAQQRKLINENMANDMADFQRKEEVRYKNGLSLKGDQRMMHQNNMSDPNIRVNGMGNRMTNGHASNLMINGHGSNSMINGHGSNLMANGHANNLMTNGHASNLMTNGHASNLMINGNIGNSFANQNLLKDNPNLSNMYPNNIMIDQNINNNLRPNMSHKRPKNQDSLNNSGIRLDDVIDNSSEIRQPVIDPRLVPNKASTPTKVIKRKVVKPVLIEDKKEIPREIEMFNFKQSVKIENGVIEEFYKDFGDYSIELNSDKTLLSIKRSKKNFFEIHGNFKFICASKKYISVYTSNIEVYDLKTGTLVCPFIGSSSVLYMDLFKNNLLFLEGDGTVVIFDIKKNTIINTRIPRYDTVIKIKFSKLYFVIVEYKDSLYTLDKITKLWYLLRKDWNDLKTETTDFENTVDETLKKLENKFLVNYINKRHSKLKKVAGKMVKILLNMKLTDQLENMFKRVFINLIKLGHKKFTVKCLEKLSKNFNLQYFIVEIMKSM